MGLQGRRSGGTHRAAPALVPQPFPGAVVPQTSWAALATAARHSNPHLKIVDEQVAEQQRFYE